MDKLQSLRMQDLQRFANVSPHYLKPLAVLGGLWATSKLFKLASFTWAHFLRPYNLRKYKEGVVGESWALVTGASDGIGLAFAQELASQGFNVVLHGRNEQKLNGIKDTLQSQNPGRKFSILVLDAINDVGDSAKIESAVAELKALNLKILINNVGGGVGEKPMIRKFIEQTPQSIDGWIDVNLRFPTQITKQVLPQLIENQPALIINIGSGASEAPSPWMSVYSGAKAYNKAWSRSLAVELLDAGHDIDCHAIVVGQVATPRTGFALDFSTPTARVMARSALGYAGTGARDVAAYWGHDVLFTVFMLLPGWWAESFIRNLSKKMIAKDLKEMEEEAKRQ